MSLSMVTVYRTSSCVVIHIRGSSRERLRQKSFLRIGAFRSSKRAMNRGSYGTTPRQLRIDASYYISRVLIPPLERIFNLVGADVRAWYDEMPKTITVDERDPLALSPRKRAPVHTNRFKIDEHFQSARCLTCGRTASDGRPARVSYHSPRMLSLRLYSTRYLRGLSRQSSSHDTHRLTPPTKRRTEAPRHTAYMRVLHFDRIERAERMHECGLSLVV